MPKWFAWPKPDAQDLEKESESWRQWTKYCLDTPPDAGSPVPGNTNHPELEDENLIAFGLENSDDKGEATVDICTVESGKVAWHLDVDDKELDTLIDRFSEEDSKEGSVFRIFFLNTLAYEGSWLPGNFGIRPNVLKALLRAGLSKVILNEIFTFEGSFAKMGAQCFEWRNTNGCISKFEMCYRAQSGWGNGKGFIQSIRTASQTTYFCINYPSGALSRFASSLRLDPTIISRDFYLDILAAVDAGKAWRKVIGQHRKELLGQERMNADDGADYYNLTYQVHLLVRDWNILSQDCAEYISMLDFLQRAYGKYRQAIEQTTWKTEKTEHTEEYLRVLKAQGTNCEKWTSVYKERTNIRINLLFHLANQREARTSKQIAISTAKVAEQTQRDSSSMITMAAVTMFFLPGTFISTILSTTFFDYGEETLSVSDKWWVLPATTIPTTITVFAVWLAWRAWRIREYRIKMEKYDVADVIEEAKGR